MRKMNAVLLSLWQKKTVKKSFLIIPNLFLLEIFLGENALILSKMSTEKKVVQ